LSAASSALISNPAGSAGFLFAIAFSSEVETGSRQENASNQESRAPFRFNRNGKGSRLVTPRLRPADIWHDLTSFEACVALAADRAAGTSS
jgi:hypothetical protein